ncbi:hypothetical protein OO015_05020 [Thermomicrobium sp. 4228-Ro]|uniref:hypothetical protein n=1 Tax=Thermomicrobium sp. 4228-Ro TaxID=2993937 RepID=UPI002248CE9C|nr:hypothetical protein [Thermomicrobium sp. 4228-Ro]MCX2726853.1 hypothetical protein [Thermomicrobium sp. 4228-Ro]
MHSAVIVSLGRSSSRVVIADRVEGQPRLLASVCVPGRHLSDAIRQAERSLGRLLLEEGHPIQPRRALGDGADAWAVVGGPATLPTLVLVAVDGAHPLVDLAVRAARASLVRVHRIDADGSLSPTMLAQQLRTVQPAFLLLAGTEDLTRWDPVLAGIASALGGELRPELGIVVAAEAVQQRVAEYLGEHLELMGVDPTAFVPAEVIRAIVTEFRVRSVARLRDEIGSDFAERVVDRLSALERAAAFLVRRAEQRLTVLDFELGTLTLWARPDGMLTLFQADRDLGPEALSLIEVDGEAVRRWTPWAASDDDIADWLANRAVRPAGVLLDPRDQVLLAAILRVLLEQSAAAVEEPALREDVTLVTLGPAFATLPAALAVLCVLDGLQPIPANGMLSIALDEADLLVASGALAEERSGYAAALLERDGLLPLAHAVVLTGDGIDGAIAVRGEVRIGESIRRFSVPWGSLHTLAVPFGTTVELTLEPESQIRIGTLDPGVALRFTGPAALGWTRLGIVIDARGRPITLPSDPTARARRLRSWLADVGYPVGGLP